MSTTKARPARALLDAQSQALTPLRTRLLRRAQIATRRTVVDLGAGTGSVTAELVRRAGGEVVAVDVQPDLLSLDAAPFAGARRVVASAARLPFEDASVDCVFCQFALLWMPLPETLDEVARVLAPGGALIAIEPDLGGMLEWPERGLRELWIRVLRGAGADPCVGRRLPMLLDQRGFAVKVEMTPELVPPRDPLAMLRGLPMTNEDRALVTRLDQPGSWQSFSWAPVLGITAVRRPSR